VAYYKYPRTYHLPWSPGLQNDDKRVESLDPFYGKIVSVSWKMDGENASCYSDHYHARSLDSKHHPSRDWMKSFHGSIKHLIPENWRVCGENLYAKHSIHYDDLPSYFMGFSIWNDENICLSWKETLEWFELIGICPVETVWEGPFEEFIAQHETIDALVTGNIEGYVVRNIESFHYADFSSNVCKVVREGHVQTDKHWMHQAIIPNQMKGI